MRSPASHRAAGHRHIEEMLNSITDDFRNRAFMREDHFRHAANIHKSGAEHFRRYSFSTSVLKLVASR